MNRSTIIRVILGALVFLGLPLYWALYPSREPVSAANGAYWNDCCGSILLNNGVLQAADKSTHYVIEQDKEGRYVLPEAFVGVSERSGVLIDQSRHPLLMRIDESNPPGSIELWKRNQVLRFERRLS